MCSICRSFRKKNILVCSIKIQVRTSALAITKVNDAYFTESGKEALDEVFQNNDKDSKDWMHKIMKEVNGRVDLRSGREPAFIDFISAFTFILDFKGMLTKIFFRYWFL